MLRVLIAALFVFLASISAFAAQLTSVQVIDQASLPRVQPDWPVPNDRNQLFYLQRSTNKNTVVYGVRFDASGNIDAANPAQAYWRRFNNQGEVKPLKRIEQQFAYGVNVRERSTPGEYTVSLKPLPELPMLLRQSGPGAAELWANIGGRTVRAVYAYVEIDEGGLIPKVTQLSLFGIDPATGRARGEVFRVGRGAIKP